MTEMNPPPDSAGVALPADTQPEGARVALSDLPSDPLLHIFAYLDYQDLISCCTLCKRFREIAQHDLLWKRLCEKHWLLTQVPDSKNWLSLFKEYYADFGRYIRCYAKIKRAWNQIEDYTKEHFPNIYGTLRDGLTEEEIDDLTLPTAASRLPDDLRCTYRIHDGQTTQEFRPTPGLFGAMEIYGHTKSEIMLDLKSALYYADDECDENMVSCIPLTSSEMSSLYIALSPENGHEVGQVIYVTLNQEGSTPCMGEIEEERLFDDFVMANSFSEYLTTYAQMLSDGRFPKIYDQIYRFPDDPKCMARTGSITVKVATCFMPGFSTVHPPRFFFIYRITMSMDVNALKSESCQLETRHWIITDESGNVETVNGPGVIGEFPTMRQGAEFSWISCTSFHTPYGNMRGHFTMRNLSSGAQIEVRCPTFHMWRPAVQTSTDRAKRLQEAQGNCPAPS